MIVLLILIVILGVICWAMRISIRTCGCDICSSGHDVSNKNGYRSLSETTALLFVAIISLPIMKIKLY